MDGLSLGEDGRPISDSKRICSCGQLLGAGQRLKLRILGGSDKNAMPGIAERYLQAQSPNLTSDEENKAGEEL